MAFTEAVHVPGGQMSDTLLAAGRESRLRWRKRLLTGLALCTLAGVAAYGARWYLESLHAVSTDDAYVNAPLAQITPQIDGTITKVLVSDTQHVRHGALLVQLDPADASLAVQQARASYEQALRRVEQYSANVNAALANVAGKQSNLRRAELDLRRRNSVSQAGAVSEEEISNARNAVDAAKSDLSMAEQQLAAQRTLTQEADSARNPEILAAKATLDRSLLDLARTQIRAPVDGVVAERHAQIGQRVKVGSTLMSVVPLMDAHVDANFKEVQLQHIRPGQKVRLTSDIYGSGVVFHGRVAGLGGGTGAAFAVIPAQNATGNWIKVVQRLPVRITLDPGELARHPLRVGVSMMAKVYLDDPVSEPPAPLRQASAPAVAHAHPAAKAQPALLRTTTSGAPSPGPAKAPSPVLRAGAPAMPHAHPADKTQAPALRAATSGAPGPEAIRKAPGPMLQTATLRTSYSDPAGAAQPPVLRAVTARTSY